MRHLGPALLLSLLRPGVPSARAADGETRPTAPPADDDADDTPPTDRPDDEGGEVFRHFTAYSSTMTCEADEQ